MSRFASVLDMLNCRFAAGVRTAVALFVALIWPGSAHARSPQDSPSIQVGPLFTSAVGRRQVRGDRPEGNSIYASWSPAQRVPDAEDRENLRTFERASFRPSIPTTIVESPPESWIAKLQRPDLPIRWNGKTIDYLRYFKDDPQGQTMIRAWMRRAGRYETRIRTIFREVGVPGSLAMVALAESGFHPDARSGVGAAGLWQFMEGTASVYGLQRSYWVDERHDIEKSTYAAAAYLQDLHTRFGSWELALAAYNAGYGIILATVERHNTNNFWALCKIESGLPFATTNYVPKIMATALVSANRAAFGVEAKAIDALPAVDWVEVKVKRSTDLDVLAKAIDLPPALLKEYNAHLIRGRTPPQPASFAVRIPRDKVEAFKRSTPKLRAAWSSETTVRVRHGESLAAIAQRHGISTQALRAMNGVRDSGEVHGGVVLVVPKTPDENREPQPPPRPLLAAVPGLEAAPDHRWVFFEVNRATTPAILEQVFEVRWSDIVAWNDLDPMARMQTGQVLQVLVPNTWSASEHEVWIRERHEVQYTVRGSRTHLDESLHRRELHRRGYRVRSGDSLEKLARRFALSVGSIARINGIPRSTPLSVGDMVIVYVDDAHLRGTTRAPAPLGFQDVGTEQAASTSGTASVPRMVAKPSARPLLYTPRPPSTALTATVPGEQP